MSLKPYLIVYGLLMLSATIIAFLPRKISPQMRRQLIQLLAVACLIISAPVFSHYAGVLYPLDIILMPAAVLLAFASFMVLLLPGEMAELSGRIKNKKEPFTYFLLLALILSGLTLALAGIM
jgi:hypothetical protein